MSADRLQGLHLSHLRWPGKPPSAPAAHTESNSYIFGVATGTVARSLRLQFTSGWVGHVALWAGINKQRAVCPDSRSPKVNQSNSVSVDWQAGGTAAWSWPVSQVLTCRRCLGFDRITCTILNAWCISDIHERKSLQCSFYYVVCFCTILCHDR